jgi:hypothetical protein
MIINHVFIVVIFVVESSLIRDLFLFLNLMSLMPNKINAIVVEDLFLFIRGEIFLEFSHHFFGSQW